MAKKKKNTNILILLQLIFEIIVALGYIAGLIPFVYIVAISWVLPLTIANLVFAAITKNGTLKFTIANVVMAVLSAIPILGYLARIAGIVLSIVSAVRVSKLIK